MKCPVCKTECNNSLYCPECGFNQLHPEFLNRTDAEVWTRSVMWPYREEYWLRMKSEFSINNRRLVGFDLERWMRKNPNVSKVIPVIPYGVDEIGDKVFERSKIVGVMIPPTVKRIGKLAFSMSKLRELEVPGSVTVIDDSAFAHCRMDNLVLNEGLETIGKEAFHSSRLSTLNIPASVTQIGDGAFYSVDRITIDKNNIHFRAIDGCLYDHENRLISSVDCSTHNIIIQKNTRVIASHAFSGNQNAKELIFVDGIREIREFAACRCLQLKKIIIANSVKIVGKSIFAGCNITNIFCEADKKPDGWDDNWNAYCNAKVYWYGSWHYDRRGTPVLN